MTFKGPAAALAALLWLASPLDTMAAASEPPTEQDKQDKNGEEDKKPPPEPKVWTSRHQIRIAGKAIDYEATTGTLLMKNDKDEPIALFGFTAYVRQGQDAQTRPILFAYNGGPGSASAWLHMGILGPRRTVIEDLETNTRGPFKLVDNEFSPLDRADVVMIDPIGTGFSRAVGKGEGKQFWGVDNDIRSVSDFIVRYLGEYQRWASPKFVLGESYGGIRTAGVSYDLLTRHNVALNGIILVSPFLDVANGWAGLSADASNANFLTTYAATAWYHKALSSQPPQLEPFLREVEAWVDSVYEPVLFKGSRATSEERNAALQGLERYTGVSAAYWEKANLRMDENRFLHELMRARGLTVGRIDSRFVGGMPNRIAETTAFDPYATAIAPAIVATFNDYARRELGVVTDQKYELSAQLWKDWDFGHVQPDSYGMKIPYANLLPDLSYAMTMNPKMKVLVQQGYYDLACPYGTVRHAIEHLNITPELRRNVEIEYYEAGHMMYVHPESMQKFAETSAAFIDASVR
ncbi:MAG: S10 family peptidase [Steroidobacter sp.]